MINIPEVKVGIVAVSRDCFPESLSVNRRKALIKAYTDKYAAKDIYEYYFANDKTKKTLEKNNKSVTETSVGTAGD